MALVCARGNPCQQDDGHDGTYQVVLKEEERKKQNVREESDVQPYPQDVHGIKIAQDDPLSAEAEG
jgi:hypothetical protein